MKIKLSHFSLIALPVLIFSNLNTHAQIIYNDGKVIATISKESKETVSCQNETWYLTYMKIVVDNLSGASIVTDLANFSISENSASINSGNSGGSINPCVFGKNAPLGWHAHGDNTHIMNNKTLTLEVMGWYRTSNPKYIWQFKYRPLTSTNSNNPSTKTNNPPTENTSQNKTSTPQSIKTKYSIKNGELIIDNGDLQEHVLIAKLSPADIRYYENLSGLKLTGENAGQKQNPAQPKSEGTTGQTKPSIPEKSNTEELDKLTEELMGALGSMDATNPEKTMKEVNRIAKIMTKIINADPDADSNMKRLVVLLVKITESDDDDVLLENLEELMDLLSKMSDD